MVMGYGVCSAFCTARVWQELARGAGVTLSSRKLGYSRPEIAPSCCRKPKLTLENGLPYTPSPYPPGFCHDLVAFHDARSGSWKAFGNVIQLVAEARSPRTVDFGLNTLGSARAGLSNPVANRMAGCVLYCVFRSRSRDDVPAHTWTGSGVS